MTISNTSSTQVLSMISQSYIFKDKLALHPSLQDLGPCRVVGVIVHESNEPELEILQHGADLPDFFPVSRLEVVG